MKRDPFEGHKPGSPPEGRIPIFDHKGNMRGHVGRTATSATVARFIGQHGAKLGKKNGKPAWLGPKPPPPKPMAAPAAQDKPDSGKSQSHKLEISLRQAKGSVKKAASK